jgi:beta-aspartyl-peptidase (threonine type)
MLKKAALILIIISIAGITKAQKNPAEKPNPAESGWVLVIHGGAGGPPKGVLTAEMEKDYLAKLEEALQKGAAVLSKGGTSLDAVEQVVRYLEDCPLFNAGKGAVLNAEGHAELDAAIMEGSSGLAGAVGGVTTVKNPVTAARTVMEKSKHVMLAGKGADRFARESGLEIVDPSYFITPERKKSFDKWKEQQHGTVGAVALDRNGNLAAATSTGGRTGKLPGRIGDTPIIGAGTFANRTCAVSATGHGEYFIRHIVCYDLAARMMYGHQSLKEAGNEIINIVLREEKADGGLIAVDADGNVTMPFNTNAMYRGVIRSDGTMETLIY